MTFRLAVLALSGSLLFAQGDNPARRWWAHTQALAGDDMEGRDTGSEGLRKAANYVVAQFERAGLKPAGESGYYQKVPLHAVRFRADQSEVALIRKDSVQPLRWLRQITTPARLGLRESIEAGLVFAGDDPSALDLKGKILVRLAAAARRGAAQRTPADIAGTLSIDSTAGPEPPRWPAAYSVSMSLAETPRRENANAPLSLRFNPADAEILFAGSGHTYKELLELAAADKPLPSFELPASLRMKLRFESGDLSSDNILAVLPGSDPALANEYVVLSAHLDGYGVGEPWYGDRIYNGAFDDAAYVAALIDFAEKLHESGTKLRRSLLFAVFTGEEKGLLGSRYFAAHPTVPKESLAADVNLDQLRPHFPLKILTTIAINESTLGETARSVAEPMGIRLVPDPEPERNLLRRADNFPLMQIGVPAIGFVFGFEKGTPEEAIYRRWYVERYHTPADDLKQPVDFTAAAKFNDFFARLVAAIANAGERPRWNAGSTFAK
jgi:hypothetical protein